MHLYDCHFGYIKKFNKKTISTNYSATTIVNGFAKPQDEFLNDSYPLVAFMKNKDDIFHAT
jgi:hypothetical protein